MVHAGVPDARIGGVSDPGQPGLVNIGASHSAEGCRVEAMVIRGDASVTVNGEVPSSGYTNMLANHHMKEAEIVGAWD